MKKKNKKNQRNIRKHARTATALSDKAKDIMTYSLEGLIREVEPMIAAVYLSCPEEATRLLMTYPQVPEFRYIVSEVAYYREDMDARQKLIGTGFFEYEVNWLLNRAKKNAIASARFVPIFYTALEHADELRLSEKLCSDLKQHINLQKQKDGYVIMYASRENLTLYFAKDVIVAYLFR